jgi:predicted transcriptional regulator
LQWFKQNGGWYSADEVAVKLEVTLRNAQKALAKLAKDGDLEVDRSAKHRKFRYRYINRDQSYSSLGLAAQESQNEQATG